MSLNTHEIIIIGKVKELNECLVDAVSIATLAHPAIEENDPEDPIVIAYHDLSNAVEAARASICENAARLAEKLS